MTARTLERVYELAREIADEAAEETIRFECSRVYDAAQWLPDESNDRITRAIEYLALRNLIEYSADGKLVRFVEG